MQFLILKCEIAKHFVNGFTPSSSGDDDINDVAAMGGVNLAEESQKILGSTEFVGTQIRSIRDEPFLHSIPLQARLKAIGNDRFLCDYWFFYIACTDKRFTVHFS